MITFEDFFRIVDIDESEKEKAKSFLSKRGINEHISLANYLCSFINRKPTYKEVATAFRYDKRIRRIVYRYLGLFEELLRAYLSDTYETINDIPNFDYKLIIGQPKMKKIPTTESTYGYTLKLLFSNLINIVKALPDKDKKNIFEENIPLKKNLDALVSLRNAISHNRTLINYKNLEEVSLSDGTISHSLVSNIINLFSLLPSETRNNFKTSVNTARDIKPNTLDNQVDWVLCDFYLLEL